MNISYNWLKEYVSFDLPAEKVAEILTFTGLEVEDMQVVEEIPGGLAGVVVGEVLECEMHPDSDHLHVTMLNIGQQDPIQVVCGAPNVAKGQKVLVATIGTKLPDGNGGEFKIKKSKMRGVESFGMICAEDELGIGSSHDGIMVLDVAAVPGTPAKDYLKLDTDVIFTIGLTPNRIDGASHIGVARDLYAYLKFNGYPTELKIPSVADFKCGEGEPIPVEVLDAEGAPRYIGVTFKNVTVKPSPEWLQKKLLAVGLRPINNVVDITNFIMYEVGQPMHAFDADKIKGGKVIVRRAEEGARFITLDGVERTLSSQDLMICNTECPMCIAGVFGGEESGISDHTTSVFLESAYFNPVTVRKTSKRHGLKTDASFRYERGADPAIIDWAAKRTALLLQELAGAQVVGAPVEFYPKPVQEKEIDLDLDRMESFIGKKIGHENIITILESLDFKVKSRNGAELTVLAPSYRVDVYRECDVVEEVLRIYGYNNIDLPENVRASINTTPKPDPELIRTKACDLLAANGFIECMSNSLTKGDYYTKLHTYPADKSVVIINPLSTDLNVMRQTLLFSCMESLEYNIKRQVTDLRIFELGKVYSYNPEKGARTEHKAYSEEMHLMMMMTGKGANSWRNSYGKGHYFALKGYMELLFRRFGMDIYNFDTKPAPADIFSEGLEYTVNGKTIAVMGTVSPARTKQCDIKMPVFACDINWDLFVAMYRKHNVLYHELPKYPAVRRDLAILVDESVSFSALRKAAFSAERKLLKQVNLFDVYRGDQIENGKKQYAISFVLQDLDKTLTDQDVDKSVNKILGSYKAQFNATLR